MDIKVVIGLPASVPCAKGCWILVPEAIVLQLATLDEIGMPKPHPSGNAQLSGDFGPLATSLNQRAGSAYDSAIPMALRFGLRRAGFLIATLVTFCGAQVNETPQSKQWHVKYATGTEVVARDWVVLTTSPEAIRCLEKPGQVAFSVPVGNVSEVVYDTRAWRRSREVSKVVEVSGELATNTDGSSMGPGPISFGAFLVLTASMGALPVAHLVKTTQHFVHINWSENGIDHEVVFQVGKAEYAPLLEELARVSGKKWKNLPKLREKVREEVRWQKQRLQQELDLHKQAKLAVWLDRRVELGSAELAAGMYRLVLLERAPGRGELCFFSGSEVDVDKIAAVTVVEITATTDPPATTEVIYTAEKNGSEGLAAIRTPEKTLRVVESSLPFRRIP